MEKRSFSHIGHYKTLSERRAGFVTHRERETERKLFPGTYVNLMNEFNKTWTGRAVYPIRAISTSKSDKAH